MTWLREFSKARDDFLSSPVTKLPSFPDLIRPTVHESWRRSRLQGLHPEKVTPRPVSDIASDGHLARAVTPIVDRYNVALEHGAYALVLTDREGRLLHRWTKDRKLASVMDEQYVAAGTTMDESIVGTTGLVTLLTGNPEMIRGPEHFSERFRDFTCSSVPIVHPINHRILGSISLVCRASDAAPIMLPWTIEFVAAIENALRVSSSQGEQRLLDAYSTFNRDARHPVVALDAKTIITNAAASRLLSGVDQSFLWEHARRSLVDRSHNPSTFTLPNGQSLTVDCRAVSHDGYDAGAVLLIRSQASRPRKAITPSIEDPHQLPGLVGHGARWRALCRQVAGLRHGGSPVLVTGEAGTGRLAVARAIQEGHDVRVIDAAEAPSLGRKRWCRELESELLDGDISLVIRHIELLSPALALATLATMRRSAPARLLATADPTSSESLGHNALLDSFHAVVEVPPLRDRLDDLPDLLAAFTDRVQDPGSGVEWMPAAIQTLSRVDWPGNLNSLNALVRRLVVGQTAGRRIGVEQLPPEYRARGARRPLANLEQTEAAAIMSALREAAGNKNQAALSLGIARSTLYRKIRALGLDLSSTVY